MDERSCGEHVPFLLKDYGVDTVFGMPGVHSLEFYRSLEEAGVRHVSVRHEQGAGFMADGYARASGKPGVAMLISGPGVTNASTAIGQAYSDSIPVLMLTAAIATGDMGLGRGMLHEITDQQAATAPLTGLSAMALTADQVPAYFAQIFTRFKTQRPRPAHLSIPLDVLEMPLVKAKALKRIPECPGPNREVIQQLTDMLISAKSLVILAGGGAVKASSFLQGIVEQSGALFVTTVAGKGILPESHPLSLGSTLQRLPTRQAIAEADLVIAIGTEIAEPDLYVTADVEAAGDVDPAMLEPRLFMSGEFIRIDIDPDTVVRDYNPDLAIVADAVQTAQLIAEALSDHRTDSTARAEQARVIRQANTATLSKLEKVHDDVLRALRSGLPDDALVYVDMTQIGYTGCVTFPVEQPGCWQFPMGFGTLGYALPAAIGGQIACPDRACVVVVGDGGLQFTLQELATAVESKLPIPIVLWDNETLGEIADFMRARQIPQTGVYPLNPDFKTLAAAYGAGYTAPQTAKDITEAVSQALLAEGPTFVHVRQKTLMQGG
ncbi:MAG: 5-guanidino-2-oxopentanoate decarboxylase [Rhodospirillales bacterium]|jgi:5-guanidino-2-oxopentanoate decarboxylase|nr:5-guanidino-2-oxopentanoate decarboxylase [Rhodospirillales bacterium]